VGTAIRGRPRIVGRNIRLNLMDYTVVGVMPKEFEFPKAAELWCPLALDARQKNSRDDHALMVLGRLRPGASTHQGEAELQIIAKRLAAAYPDTNHGWGATLLTVRDWLSGYQTRAGVIMVLVAVGFVLLIACANVTNVLLARSVSRRKEIALRTALGASRWRIVRQLLTESMLLSGAGSLLGLVMAQWELSLIVSHMPASVVKYIPWWRNISLDWRALLFTAGVALFAGVAAGLLPAVQSSRPDLNTALKEAARSTSARPRRLRSLLLVGEIALSLTLLIGSALMARGSGALQAAPGDRQPESMLTVQLSLPNSGYPDAARIAQFQSRLLSSLAEIPGVRDAAVTNMVPYAPSDAPQVFTAEGQAPERSAGLSAFRVKVSPGFLRLMRVPLRAGRFLTEADGQNAPKVVVVSESVARRCWPGQNPIGKQVRFGRADSREPWMTVAGVGRRHSLELVRPRGRVHFVRALCAESRSNHLRRAAHRRSRQADSRRARARGRARSRASHSPPIVGPDRTRFADPDFLHGGHAEFPGPDGTGAGLGGRVWHDGVLGHRADQGDRYSSGAGRRNPHGGEDAAQAGRGDRSRRPRDRSVAFARFGALAGQPDLGNQRAGCGHIRGRFGAVAGGGAGGKLGAGAAGLARGPFGFTEA
jgi:predicted permease